MALSDGIDLMQGRLFVDWPDKRPYHLETIRLTVRLLRGIGFALHEIFLLSRYKLEFFDSNWGHNGTLV